MEDEFYNNISSKYRPQDRNVNQLKVNANKTCRKDEEKTTNFEFSNDEDVVNKAFLHLKKPESKCHTSFIQKECNYFVKDFKRASIGTLGDQSNFNEQNSETN